MEHNFTIGVQAPKSDKKLPVYLTLQELKQLFTYLENDTGKFALRNHLMFKLLATTGMRRQELVDLTWGRLILIIKRYASEKDEKNDSSLFIPWLFRF